MSGRIAGLFAVLALSVSACATSSANSAPSPPSAPETQAATGVNPQAKTLAAFQESVKQYMALHHKLEGTLAPLPNDASPEQINKHQLALAEAIRTARRTAQAGEFFNPEMRRVIRGLMSRVFAGLEGAQMKAAIMDENPGRIRIRVNDRYPDAVPLSTVPPQVLADLPKLPTELEYRFIGRGLILFDSHAHMIVDIMENAIP